MPAPISRYPTAGAPRLAEGWTLRALTAPSALYGANGMRAGADGRIYVAQVVGSQISAVDVDTGQVEVVSPLGGPIVAPDDLAFGPDGAIYATEVMNARVGVREPSGATRVLREGLPMVNGITFHRGRLFVDESRHGGRVMELDLAGGEPRVLVESIPTGNALEVGPDGMLYFPVMEANEIWRVDPDGGAPQRVAGDLGVPDAVKFDPQGYIVSTQVATGEVLRIDPRSGQRTVLAQLDPALDNLAFVGDRLFISSIPGQITEILPGGKLRPLFAGALNYPLGLAMADDGRLYVADGPTLFTLTTGGELTQIASLFSPGCPGYVRGVAAVGGGEFVFTTANGVVARYRPFENESEVLASGFQELYGVALAPGGAVVAADMAAGRVVSIKSGVVEELARGLSQPRGVAIDADGACFVSESGAGRVVEIAGGRVETVLDGLEQPHGVLVLGRRLYVVDAAAKTLVAFDLDSRTRSVIASELPVGAPRGVVPKRLSGFPPLSGPMGPFSAIAAGPDGVLYLSADGNGSVIALTPPRR
jgi:sugar lactone lactonase YvrE